MAAELILFASFFMVGYVYAGYPLVLWLLGRHRGESNTLAVPIVPPVSLVIAVHNEAAVISGKIQNTLALDYPREKLEIMVASDGSTDSTEEIVMGYRSRGVQLLSLSRCGKMRALEHSAAKAHGEILVFTDANTWIEPQAMRALVAHFADPEVGGVCGRKRIGRTTNGVKAVLGEGVYWKYEQLLKRWESLTGSTVAADGAFYGIRRELFLASADPAQADDMAISARIPVQGKRLIFESKAVVWEEPPASVGAEFRRKVRIANHVIRCLWELKKYLNPMRAGFFAVQLWSHKLLRYFVPVPLAAAWTANYFLAGGSLFYSTLLILQSGFYILALAGMLLSNLPQKCSPLFHGPFYFCMAHSAALMGAFSALRGKRIVAWQHQRSASGAGTMRTR